MEAKITGVTDLLRTFYNLPKATQNKAMRPALRAGAKVISKAASENIRAITSDEATGLAARNVRVYSMRVTRAGDLRMGVMIKKGLVTSKGVRVGLYASVLEYGKLNQPPRSWLRKAARETPSEVIKVVTDKARERMDDAIKDAKNAG